MKHKCLFVLLTLCMLLSLMPTTALASGNDATEPEENSLKIGTIPVCIIDESTGS